MKTVEFIYQENEIHFLVNPTDKNVMINATEMAKIFKRRTEDFLKTQSTKDYVKALEEDVNHPLNRGRIIENRGRNGVFFERKLALKFATWLDVQFELWVFSTIDEIIFGNYKKHWDAHADQEVAKVSMENLKSKLLLEPTVEIVQEYFQSERDFKAAKNAKTNAIRNQLKLFGN